MPEGKEPPDQTDQPENGKQTNENEQSPATSDSDDLRQLREAKADLPDDEIDRIMRKAFGQSDPNAHPGDEPPLELPEDFDERFLQRLREAEEDERNRIDPATGQPFPPNVAPFPEQVDDSEGEAPDANQPPVPPRPPTPGPGLRPPKAPHNPTEPQSPTGGDNGDSSK